tara:strand:+ start:4443 stop:5315 length:873 start_codon:yes stop_codon:yes gene_type:complete
MRFVIIGDLHGVKPNIYYQTYDAIIAPGDFCSSDKIRDYMFQVIEERKKDKKYDKEWYDLVGKRRARKLVKESLEIGREVLEYLDSLGVPVYVVPGNADWVYESKEWKFLDKNYFEDFLMKGLKNVVNCHEKFVPVNDELGIVGYGLSSYPELPQHTEDMAMLTPEKFEKKEKEYNEKKEMMCEIFRERRKGKEKRRIIFLSHNVPFNTPLDIIRNKKSPRDGQHYGSILARELIEIYKPIICVAGHMHEHFGACKIGKTTVINSGFGKNVNVWLEVNDMKKKVEFYKGN